MNDYLDKSENSKIILHTKEGGTYELECQEIERPEKDKLENLCSQKAGGKAVFEDKVRITPEQKVYVYKAEMYYSGEKVAEKTFPEIMLDGDTLEFVWQLEIGRRLPSPKELMAELEIPEKKSD